MISCSTAQLAICTASTEHFATLKMVQRQWTCSLHQECPGTYFAYFVYFAYYAYLLSACRHVLRASQPIYGFWCYFMIHRGIGNSLQKILPKFIPRNDTDVDALLDCKLRVYVLHILHILYILHISNFECVRLKKNGKDAKEILLIGPGFHGYIDHLFWFLPFSCPKQAYEMLANKEMSDENWNTKRDELKAEHLLEQAPVDLRVGWKAWIAEHGSVADAAVAVPATEITSVIRP